MSKILHICTGFSVDYQGGITNYVRSLAKEQSENGDEIFILADDGHNDGYVIIKYTTRIRKTSFYNKKDFFSFSFLKKFFSHYCFDLVHIHMMLNMDVRLVNVLADLHQKYIVSLHDYFYLCPRIQMVPYKGQRCTCVDLDRCLNCFSVLYKTIYLRKILEKVFGLNFVEKFPIRSKKLYLQWYNTYKKLLNNASLLLPVSNRVKEIYESSGICAPMEVLHIGNVSANNFDSIHKQCHSGKIKVVFLSYASEIKGGKLFCELISRTNNKNLEFHFFGRCPKQILTLMKKSGVVVHGQYNQSDLPSILKQMNLGVALPIWEDNGPQVVMEMLNNKLPILATMMGGIPDFVNDDNGFLFNPFTENGVISAVNFLNDLTYDVINSKIKNIKRTLTPHEHYLAVESIYKKII